MNAGRRGSVAARLRDALGGLVHDAACDCENECGGFRKTIYGAAVSRLHEPVDQIAAFLIAKDIQERHPDFEFFPLSVARFGLLNARRGESLKEKNLELKIGGLRKQLFHLAMMDHLGLKGRVFLTDNFWDDPLHWAIAEELLDADPSLIPPESPFAGTFYRFNEISQGFSAAIGPELMARLASIDGPRLYALIEVAHIMYMAQRYGVDSKLGPVTERPFDAHVGASLHIAHHRQPVDLLTHAGRVQTLSPYIGKPREERIYFCADDAEAIGRVLSVAEARCLADPPFYYDEMTASNVLNPIVQHAVYAVEAARLTSHAPVRIAGSEVSCGMDVLRLARERGVAGWAPDVADLLWWHVVEPINEIVRKRWNLETQLQKARERFMDDERYGSE